MDLQYISENDWCQFECDYRAAFNFLLRASMVGEWEYLKGCQHLSPYQTQRFSELNSLFKEK